MSASLVGSEMCIRDRFYAGAGAPSASDICAGRSNPSPMPASSGLVTVSYTHLTLPTICSV
eukprot:2959896-Alexandrium_andersonii.AAC.1